MPDERLFSLDEIPEVPLFREPRRSRGAAISDERLSHDYPPEWDRCPTCRGTGYRFTIVPAGVHGGILPLIAEVQTEEKCGDCLAMGSVKARVRLEAGHRCVRCHHPYMPKGDAKMLGVEPTPGRWSPCDERCAHGGVVRLPESADASAREGFVIGVPVGESVTKGLAVEAEWRILTVHHLDGDKANLSWWNLAALCQRCHLQIQAKVVMERVYAHEHSDWFKPYAAGWYAKNYLGEDLSRDETLARLDDLLALELGEHLTSRAYKREDWPA